MKSLLYAVSLLFSFTLPALASPPATFTEAKVVAKQVADADPRYTP